METDRTYRNHIRKSRLTPFRVIVKETDLYVHSRKDLSSVATERVLHYRGFIENYISRNPEFAVSLVPWRNKDLCPEIIRDMVDAGVSAGVGPMAAVAGSIAERVGMDLLEHTDEVMIENGGDVFIKTNEPVDVGIYAGNSPLSLRIALRIDSSRFPVSLCTSSGTFGHSLSLGKADAVCVKSRSCALADAAATAIGNQVRNSRDIEDAISMGGKIEGVLGVVVIVNDVLGAWGDLEVISGKGKKP
jgi:ApbE superfamily uncharacterized protein (UPF0280 family)